MAKLCRRGKSFRRRLSSGTAPNVPVRIVSVHRGSGFLGAERPGRRSDISQVKDRFADRDEYRRGCRQNMARRIGDCCRRWVRCRPRRPASVHCDRILESKYGKDVADIERLDSEWHTSQWLETRRAADDGRTRPTIITSLRSRTKAR